MEKKSLISSRYVISKRDKRQLLQKINKYYKGKILEYISSARKVEVVKTRIEGIVIIMVNSRPLLFSIKDKFVPTVIGYIKYGLDLDIPRIYVDSGAVPHILNGADIMAPGIVRASKEFDKGEIVYVGEDETDRIFSVGETLMSYKEIFDIRRGKAIKNLHYAGDKIWKLIINELL